MSDYHQYLKDHPQLTSDDMRFLVGMRLAEYSKESEAYNICEAVSEIAAKDADCNLIAVIRAGLSDNNPDYDKIGRTLIEAIIENMRPLVEEKHNAIHGEPWDDDRGVSR